MDLNGKTAVISQQLEQFDGRLAVSPPRTAHSTRVIALDRTTVAALEMLGHSSIVLTADPYTSVLPDAAHAAAEKVAGLIIKAGCLVPGTRRRRRRQARCSPRRPGTHARCGQSTSARRSRAHPARQIGRL